MEGSERIIVVAKQVLSQLSYTPGRPFGEEVYEFRETWTLSREMGGNYQVKGERRFRLGKDKDVVTRPFAVELSRDLTVLRLTEFSKLKWIQDSGPLTCEFLSAEMRCSAGVRKPNVSNDWHLEVRHPYGSMSMAIGRKRVCGWCVTKHLPTSAKSHGCLSEQNIVRVDRDSIRITNA
jgi:hypothetical protein